MTALLLAAALAAAPAPKGITLAEARLTYSRGTAFLLTHQNRDGSWGGPRYTTDFDLLATAPGSPHAFRVACTALGAMALRTPSLTDPHIAASRQRALDYLVRSGTVKRSTDDELYNIWAHGFTLEALSQALLDVPRPDPKRETDLKHAIAFHLKALERYETAWGGWNYYDFAVGSAQPSMEPVSFGTATILLNLHAAQAAGVTVPPSLVKRALAVLAQCRKSDGSFLYAYNHRFRPMHLANRDKGSLGRSQVGNLALFRYREPTVGVAQLQQGFERLIREHRFLEIGRKRQYPHEAWYKTSGYYYYYGHYYAGEVLRELPAAVRPRLAAQLLDTVVPHQETDGSWWDYKMNSYHWAYGTAFALLTIESCLPFLPAE